MKYLTCSLHFMTSHSPLVLWCPFTSPIYNRCHATALGPSWGFLNSSKLLDWFVWSVCYFHLFHMCLFVNVWHVCSFGDGQKIYHYFTGLLLSIIHADIRGHQSFFTLGHHISASLFPRAKGAKKKLDSFIEKSFVCMYACVCVIVAWSFS